MQSPRQGSSASITANSQHRVYSVTFADNGKQVLSGGVGGMIRRWRADNAQEIGHPIRVSGARIYSIAASPDRKRLVCGLKFPDIHDGKALVGVWDMETQQQVLEVQGHRDSVLSVHISFDSLRFATGGSDKLAFIWDITTGKRLLGPLQHDGWVVAVRFSPRGDRIATATAESGQEVAKSIRVYNSNNGQRLQDIPFPTKAIISSPLAWSNDGHKLFAVSYNEASCFDMSSGPLRTEKWTIPGKSKPTSITLARNGKFIVISSSDTISFWDASTHKQIVTAISQPTVVWSIALSCDDDSMVVAEENGKITFMSLPHILPSSYFAVKVTSQLPLIHLDDVLLKSWTQGDLNRVEELLTKEITYSSDPFLNARAFAYRSFVRYHLKQRRTAMDDAKKSVGLQQSLIGHIANALTYAGDADYELTMRTFDLVFTEGLVTENNLLLLIKAIILFECGKHHIAISRVDDLIDIVEDRLLFTTVQAQMLLLFASMLLKKGDSRRAVELLGRARKAAPFQPGPRLEVISLLFGWDFDGLDQAIQRQLQECLKPLEGHGDAGISDDPDNAIMQYTAALSLNPSNSATILIKRSKLYASLGSWEEALKDADEIIKIDPMGPWGFNIKHAALHGLRRYGEAVDAFSRMLSLIEESPDPDIRQLAQNYISPSKSERAIEEVIRGVTCPLVLIDVEEGCLLDRSERTQRFKSEPEFKELVSSMTEALDDARIQQVVKGYFRYVTLSHVWQGKEPTFQDLKQARTVFELDRSVSLNEKLRRFCEVVRNEGYRWAWSDTCCIDKTISTVLNESLMSMYKWYESSTSTFVFLADVLSPSVPGSLKGSNWMTRAWTAQELLAARVVRFYDRSWQLYLGDGQLNHKQSSQILQELADAIEIARETITAFNPDDLSIREKLRLASARRATMEEDMAYSLIGIFKSDIIPRYGEGDAALGHLLEEIVARTGDVTVLDWTGKSSSYNSCLPAALEVYGQPPRASLAITDEEMGALVETLKDSSSREDAMKIYDGVSQLPVARFANRRLNLPCIVFTVKKLLVEDFGSDGKTRYSARVAGIGDVRFQTSDRLSPTEPRRLICVHPWIRNLSDPLDGYHWGSMADEEGYDSDQGAGTTFVRPTLPPRPGTRMDGHMRALRLIARLRQPFHALLLHQEPNGDYKRVAAEHDVVVSVIDRSGVHLSRDIQTKVVEIL